MSDIADSPEGPTSRPDGLPPNGAALRARVSAPVQQRSIWRWLWLPLLLVVIAAAVWFRYGRELGIDSLAVVETAPPAAPAASVEVDALRRTLDDAARVNRAMREQLLGLTQRVGLVEDGLAGVERGAAPGIDAMRLAEADFLLRLGDERLRLFGDVSAAREAFALADGQLSQVSDPRATSVRQTLALERDALAGVASADLPLILAQLDRLADGVVEWPLRGRDERVDSAGAAATEPGWWVRVATTVDRYFRVRRVDPDERDGAGPLLRERIALDLSRARLLLLRNQGAPALAAIESVRSELARDFDATDSRVTEALRALDDIRRAPLSPQWPELGESRRELARLRGAPMAPASPAAPAADLSPAPPADASLDALPASAPDAVIASPDQPTAEAELVIDRAQSDAAATDDAAGPGDASPDGN